MISDCFAVWCVGWFVLFVGLPLFLVVVYVVIFKFGLFVILSLLCMYTLFLCGMIWFR